MAVLRFLLVAVISLSLSACGDALAPLDTEESVNNSLGSNDPAEEGTDLDSESSHSSTNDDSSPEPIVFAKMDWDNMHQEAPLWNEYTYQALLEKAPNLINFRPADITSFCPRFDELNEQGRMMFWVHLFSVMTRYESFFNPSVKHQEAFNDYFGNPVISRGLLQLSYESGKGMGCDLKNQYELHDTRTNLYCGVTIMNKWVLRDGVLSRRTNGKWYGAARYWAVFRTYSKNDLVQKVKNRVKSSEICR